MIVATLAHPGGLASTLVEAAAAAAGAVRRRWLDEGRAADLFVDAHGAGRVRAALDSFTDSADVVVQPLAERDRRLFVADMDSTMVTVECLDELADYAAMKPQVAEITARAMRGELDFAGALKARVALLSGMDAALIARCLAERVRPAPGAATLMATLAARGVRTVLVSGGFTAFVEPVAAMLGFDRSHGNRLEVQDGRLTGRVSDPILGGESKRQTLFAEARALGIEAGAALAAGDGANDAAMLEAAGLGIAVHGKPAAVAAADAAIRHGDLTTILWALGLPSRDWLNRA